MKVKALRSKSTGKFLHFTQMKYEDTIFEEGQMVESTLPELLESDITLEGLLDHYAMAYPQIDTSDFELAEFDLIETGTVGADIRNKLSPFKNLIALIGVYMLEKSEGKKILMKGHINKDLKQARASLEYLTKLFD
jgi:hypothetical protein